MAKSAKPPQNRPNRGQFKPGQSGNPGGRPKGIVDAVKALVGQDGNQLITALHALAFGTDEQRKAIFGDDVTVNTRERREAIESLLDRGFGRAVQALEHSSSDDKPMQVLFYLPDNGRK